MEFRKDIRYGAHAPVIFSWYRGRHQRVENGYAEDISTRGVYVVCRPDCCPPLGKRLSITVSLPAAGGSAPGAILKGKGKVIRRDVQSDTLTGFAVETYLRLAAIKATASPRCCSDSE